MRALDGLRVVDLSTRATGPFATQLLAELGATVLKVERPPAGDPERHTEPAMFRACNRGKHSVALDVRADADRRLLDELLADTDVFVEGFRPGVADRMGLGFADVCLHSPRVVYVSLPGFGSTGPRAGTRTYDTQLRAVAGELALNAGADGVPRYDPASPTFDFAAAMYAALGVVTSMLGDRTEAVHLEVPILAAGLAWTFARLTDRHYADAAARPGRYVFATSDGRYLTINAGQDDEYVALCNAIDRPDLLSDDLRTRPGRQRARTEIDEAVAAAIRSNSLAHWMERLTAFDVPAAPVLQPDEVFDDPQVRELNVVHDDPEPWAELPIFGIDRRALRNVPRYDHDGANVRAAGWSALASGSVASGRRS
jgi:crotonobetainyl-CoA:carnitine CoA-transferase CaiB-like acyl-CoA transferase